MPIPDLLVAEIDIKSHLSEFCSLDTRDQFQLTHYIYPLSDPLTDEVCYVGETKFPSKRLTQHCDLKLKSNLYFYKWICDLQDIHRIGPMMHVFLSVYGLDSFEKIFDIEKDVTLSFWRKGHPLLNKVHLVEENERKNRIFSSNYYRRVLADFRERKRDIF